MNGPLPLKRTKPLIWIGIGALIVAAFAVRLCYLIVAYHAPLTTTRRPHIETAALLFGICGFVFRFATDVRAVENQQPSPSLGWTSWLGFAAIALALYWPALSLGLLSDDFILVQHAADWNVRQVAPQLFRPLPILVWSIVLHLGGGPKAIHLVNILLHATNAYLASLIVAGWRFGGRWPAIAGLLVLTAPLGPEAVAWCSGTFDLFAAAFLMGAVLVARRDATPFRNEIQFVVLAVAAVLSKETAVVLPLLLLLDAGILSTKSRRLLLNLTIATGVVVGFAIVRLRSVESVGRVSRYRLQRLVFDSFGSLAAPWHAQLTASEPFLRPTIAILVIALLTGFFLLPGPRYRSRIAIGTAMWVFISVLPLITIFYVGAQLEGARYLYLASTGWAALLVVAANELSQGRLRAGPVAAAALGILLVANVVGVRAHLARWTHAATVRDAVLRAASADQRLHLCDVVYLQNLPDSVDGAYVFANGAREALSNVGVNAFVKNEPGSCSFRWDPTINGFVPRTEIP